MKEIYRLVNGSYQLQIGEPFWMPEIGLGIGRYVYTSGQVQRQLLCWYDRKGQRLQLPEELLVQEQQRTEHKNDFGQNGQNKSNELRSPNF